MLTIRGDLFDPNTYIGFDGVPPTPDAICVTTNGFVKKNGEAVMGRGCAKRAAEILPGLPEILGNALRIENTVWAHGPWNEITIVTFPVKPASRKCKNDKSNVVKHMRKQFNPGDKVPGWACVAEPRIIEKSARSLLAIADSYGWNSIVLPRPGCGFGELKWDHIYPILQKILDNRFYCITY